MLETDWPVWARGQILAARGRAAAAALAEEDEESDPFGAALETIAADDVTPPPTTPSHSTRSARSRVSVPSVVIETHGPRALRKHARSPSADVERDDAEESESEVGGPIEESDEPVEESDEEEPTGATSTRALRPRATHPAPPKKKRAKMMVPRAAQATEPVLGKHWRVSSPLLYACTPHSTALLAPATHAV